MDKEGNQRLRTETWVSSLSNQVENIDLGFLLIRIHYQTFILLIRIAEIILADESCEETLGQLLRHLDLKQLCTIQSVFDLVRVPMWSEIPLCVSPLEEGAGIELRAQKRLVNGDFTAVDLSEWSPFMFLGILINYFLVSRRHSRCICACTCSAEACVCKRTP
jgi:hypothetical protein